ASNPAWEGHPLAMSDISAEGKQLTTNLFDARVSTPKRKIIFSRDKQIIYAVAPLFFGGDPARIGLLYHEYGMQPLKASWQKTLHREVFFVFSLSLAIVMFLLFFLYVVLFRRARRVCETINRFGLGENTARSQLGGADELAVISTALDKMLDLQVAAEKQIRDQTLLLRQLTDGLPVLIAYVDQDACFRFINQEFENWFYLKPEQIIGRQACELFGEKNYREISSHLTQALSGKTAEYEGAIPIDNGSLRQFHATLLPHFENGSGVQGCFLLAQDITQLKQDQEQIRKAKEQWELTFDSILDEIITVQDKDFRILQANKAASVFFDLPRDEIVGRRCHELFREDDVPCSECPAYAVLQEGKTHAAELYHERLKKTFWVTMSPMVSENGKFYGLVHSAKDITEFKQLEQKLRQSQKMEAIGALAGGIAHDFNNILTPILGYSELIAGILPNSSPERGMAQEIEKAGRRAKELVKQILTFSRQGEQQRQLLQIHLIIKEALKLLRSSIPTTIAIHQNVVDCGMVLADPTQVHQVLMNLCTNAYSAMREKGGELTVSLSVVDLTENDYLDNMALQPGPHVRLSVRDTGCGMSTELVERIFEPYFTTKKQGEGTGIGLAVVHGIIQSYNGHITVYSEPDRGTEFHVYLPQVQATGEKLLVDTEMVPAIPPGSCTVLVVDDEKIVGQTLQQVLLSLGYEVLLCTGSAEGLETFKQNIAQIGLVLTDMTMPGMNGVELTRKIKRLSPVTPVVLCTGFSDLMDAEKAKRIGLDGFLLKPVIRSQLAKALHEARQKKSDPDLR
ncbi:MAG: PAS domain-containing protein, partial [Desulfobulbaceae bacterium]|nr:PAS domain-containing protein [Desulfobulbaceae bacterium]